VVLGDSLEVLRSIPDGTFDMAFADPPFNLGKRYGNYDDSRGEDEYLAWCDAWLREMVRVVRDTGSIFVHNVPRWLTHYSTTLNQVASFRHWIAWDAWTAPIGNTLLPTHYGILWYTRRKSDFRFFKIRSPHARCRKCDVTRKDFGGYRKKMHPLGSATSDVWTDIHRLRHSRDRDPHPCQLPVHLLERMILMTTEPGDLVLDPFLGAGTTAIAARKLGRRYMGIDVDPDYVRIAREKVETAEETVVEGCHVSIHRDEIVTIRDVDWEMVSGAYLVPEDLMRERIRRKQ